MPNLKLVDIYPEKYESCERYCPICDTHILPGDFLHKCSEEDLKKIDENDKIYSDNEEKINEPPRTFDEKLEEAQKMIEQD